MTVAASLNPRPQPSAGGISVSEFFRYHGLWAPGVRLFRAIGFRAKATIIALTFVLPIVVLAWQYLGDKADAIAFSAKERDGVAVMREALPLLQMLQRQRLADAQLAPPDAALAPALREQWTRFEAVHKTHAEALGTGAAYDRLLAAGKAGAAGADPVALFAARTPQIVALIDLLGAVADGSNLTLDPDLDTYYLMDAAVVRLPAMAEWLGQLSGPAAAPTGTGALDAAAVRHVAAHGEMFKLNQTALAAGLDKALRYNPAIKPVLHADTSLAAIDAFKAQVDQLLSGRGKPDVATRQKAMDAMFDLAQRSNDELDRLIGERVGRLQASRNLTIGVLALSMLAALYLFVAFRKVLDGGLREVAFHIDSMRNGDLTTQPRAWGQDEVAGLMNTLVDMQQSLRRIVVQVRGASDHIVVSSTQISSGAHDLSARTERSAANLQQSAAAMEEISTTVRQTAGSAQDASEIAGTNSSVASRGGEIIATMVQTMQGIHASSSRIGDIIGTIDSIAFQTNILALNAAVEAARAGEQGRGFAVVASEVRALSQRTASAAREIKALITTSVDQVASGTEVVQLAGSTIREIVETSREVNRLLAEIATSADEQSRGVAQTTQAVQDLDNVTQQNAALVEQTAAAAQSLQQQAKALAVEVSQFKLPAVA
jgi:methyl-accepting chemotaxis protein